MNEDSPSRSGSFWAELQRRRVLRVAALYAVVAWLLAQVAATVFPALQLPDWTVTLVVALLILGFPIALVIAWAFDVGPQGIERSDSSHRSSGWLGFGALLLVSFTLAGTVTYLRYTSSSDDENVAPKFPRIAVLPIADLSPGGSQLHLSDGFHDELISQLSTLSGIAVSSRTSVMPYRTATKSAIEIAAELQVDVIVEGSIRYDNDRMRFTAQLIDGKTDEHIWANRYDAQLSTDEIFAIQEDVAIRIAEALQVQVTEMDRTHLARIPTGSLDAYEQYALGRYHLWRWNPVDLARAITFLEQALEHDPDFAEANADLGWAFALSGTSYGTIPPVEAIPKAKRHTRRALELAPGLHSARELLLNIQLWYDWEWHGLDEGFRELIADYPQASSPNVSYAFYLAAASRFDEAIEHVEMAMRKNPRSPSTLANAGWRYLYGGQCEDAIEVSNEALAIDNSYNEARFIIGHCELLAGNLDDALALFERLDFRLLVAHTLGRLGREEEARAIVDEYVADFEAGAYFPPLSIAIAMVGIGDHDATFEWLQRAVDARSRNLVLLNADPMWAPIRDDPRYAAIAARVGLPDAP